MKVKVITGYREDQYYSIPAEEAHKAYFLFKNPEERGIFANGVALIGKNIQGIEPDWQGTMGWNAAHKLDSDDWNEIRRTGTETKLRKVLENAKQVADMVDTNPRLMALPLEQALQETNHLRLGEK